ncbi:MAG: hypothetical protein ACUZ77_05810 [Candidatus Brocadiales bacterium]
MARPTQNFAIDQGFVIGVAVNVMSFPGSDTGSTPVIPYQRLFTILADPSTHPEHRVNDDNGKCHIIASM